MKRITTQCIALLMTLSFLAPCVSAQESRSGDELYLALGKKEGIARIVDDLLRRVYDDARLKAVFKDADRERLAAKLAEQFCLLSGGPCAYTGKDMKLIHDGLDITHMQFNALAEDLQDAMDGNGVPYAAQNRLLAKLAPMQRDIVTR